MTVPSYYIEDNMGQYTYIRMPKFGNTVFHLIISAKPVKVRKASSIKGLPALLREIDKVNLCDVMLL